ncbi:hypothetical protein E0H22_11070 [Rhodopseudomonas boonkerdii]|uniref:hypothetical protein n=1 Tax=Rhodopseudomonas boonkerdii TaxID=475937 RepID=UPI001E4A4BF1|nr:hypothetical protein [Rhodopseudomonas boonkerdii]UGV26183.1 hypothetical protein E0H22_11070 [Rhodopseudomonas boonkerdii]
MRRVLVLTAAGLSLAGCSSFSMDAFKSAPEPVTVQFESTPPGAEAKTSIGPACTTPCSLPIVTEGNFEVTFTLPKFQPVTVPVSVTRVPGDFTSPARTTVDPSPVVAELQPATPPRKGRKAAKKRAAAPAPAAAPAEAGTSPFPNPR